jgi:hypothetical protein
MVDAGRVLWSRSWRGASVDVAIARGFDSRLNLRWNTARRLPAGQLIREQPSASGHSGDGRSIRVQHRPKLRRELGVRLFDCPQTDVLLRRREVGNLFEQRHELLESIRWLHDGW